MSRFILRWAATALAIGVAAQVLPGFEVAGVWPAIVAALLLGLVNLTVRPALFLLTLPLTVITLGLFALVLNGAMLALVAAVVKGVHVAGFGSAVLGAIVISLVGSVLTWLMPPNPSVHVEVRRFHHAP